MDLTRPPRELVIEPGDWRTMEGRVPTEQLSIRPAGPLLSASRAGWVVVTGWRDLPGGPGPEWTVAMVRQAAVVEGDDEPA